MGNNLMARGMPKARHGCRVGLWESSCQRRRANKASFAGEIRQRPGSTLHAAAKARFIRTLPTRYFACFFAADSCAGRKRFSRNAFMSTDTELKDIAAAAIIGLSNGPP